MIVASSSVARALERGHRIEITTTGRHSVLAPIAAGWGYPLETMVVGAPLIEVTFPEGL